MNNKLNKTDYPDSWELVRLGDFVKNEKGKKPRNQNKTKTLIFHMPYIDIEAFEKGVYKSWTDGQGCRLTTEDDFLMVWDGSRSGLVGKGVDGALGSTLVRINFPQIYNLYAYYFLKSKFLEINTRAKGSGTPHVDPDLLWNYQFPIPPFKEQKRIVEKIDELFSELDEAEKSLIGAQELLNVYLQSLLQYAFEGKLTEKWRTKNNTTLKVLLSRISQEISKNQHKNNKKKKSSTNTFRQIKSDELSELPNLPSNYTYMYLSDLGEIGRGKSKHRPRNDPQLFGGPYPFIQTGEVKSANRIINQFNNTYNEFGLQQSKLWPKGTLCITIAANIAETAFLGFDCCFPDSIVGFLGIESIIVPEYLELFIKSIQKRIEFYAPATAQKNINLTTLENLIIPICSIEEQQEIANQLGAYLSIIDKIDNEIKESFLRIKTMRQSILEKAFSGQLVHQNPDDEPAYELLARIKSEQKNLKNQKSKPKKRQKVAT